ncbi:MAG: hypothetical protein GC181_03990 [Bacteroidetes bacterium]|nr:hypothetical protein [Bacteroidota bacterium]
MKPITLWFIVLMLIVFMFGCTTSNDRYVASKSKANLNTKIWPDSFISNRNPNLMNFSVQPRFRTLEEYQQALDTPELTPSIRIFKDYFEVYFWVDQNFGCSNLFGNIRISRDTIYPLREFICSPDEEHVEAEGRVRLTYKITRKCNCENYVFQPVYGGVSRNQ